MGAPNIKLPIARGTWGPAVQSEAYGRLRAVTAIVDTGPLVALLDAREPHHAWARETLRRLETALQTCEAVLSEACFLLSGVKGGCNAALSLMSA